MRSTAVARAKQAKQNGGCSCLCECLTAVAGYLGRQLQSLACFEQVGDHLACLQGVQCSDCLLAQTQAGVSTSSTFSCFDAQTQSIDLRGCLGANLKSTTNSLLKKIDKHTVKYEYMHLNLNNPTRNLNKVRHILPVICGILSAICECRSGGVCLHTSEPIE